MIAAAALAAVLLVTALPVSAQLPLSSPKWAELSPQERQVLAPLASEWNQLDATRKAKWRGIAQRYARMPPDDQQRVMRQMRPWSQLTPQERMAAREQYKSLRQLPPEQKGEVKQRWEQYQSLPPERRRELADKAPPPGSKPGGRIPAPGMAPPRAKNARDADRASSR